MKIIITENDKEKELELTLILDDAGKNSLTIKCKEEKTRNLISGCLRLHEHFSYMAERECLFKIKLMGRDILEVSQYIDEAIKCLFLAQLISSNISERLIKHLIAPPVIDLKPKKSSGVFDSLASTLDNSMSQILHRKAVVVSEDATPLVTSTGAKPLIPIKT